jgi:hypothetical protein
MCESAPAISTYSLDEPALLRLQQKQCLIIVEDGLLDHKTAEGGLWIDNVYIRMQFLISAPLRTHAIVVQHSSLFLTNVTIQGDEKEEFGGIGVHDRSSIYADGAFFTLHLLIEKNMRT